MQLFRAFPPVFALGNQPVAAIGNFDGVHVGHQFLLSQLTTLAQMLGRPSLVIIFEPQPGEFFNATKAPARLTRLSEKLAVFQQLGIDFVYCPSFNEALAKQSADVFARETIFTALQVHTLFVGHDFRFGAARIGDVALLEIIAKDQGARVVSVPDYMQQGERVSSTRVRFALKAGDFDVARQLLGRPYTLRGRVVYGDGRGRTIGFPTANVNMHRVHTPLLGVFCVLVRFRAMPLKTYHGVANIGTRPTVDGRGQPRLEIHLLNYHERDWAYGQALEVTFLHALRAEQKFASLDLLIAQIKADVQAALAYFETKANKDE